MSLFPNRHSVRNRLLVSMSSSDFDLVASRLDPVELPMGGIVEEAGEHVDHVVFVESGIGSRIVVGNGNAQTEGGHIGREGMTGRSVILASPIASERIQMQVAGKGLRIQSDLLLDAMSESDTLRRLMLRYVQASQVQSEHTLLAATSYSVEQRLARWLLMYNDRVDGDQFPVTHELLAKMLNVRRAGITTGMHMLQGNHAIRSTRGIVQVLNRDILIGMAGGSYGIPERDYEIREVPGLKKKP
ncbi:MAG: Crp/Fnr family transcriptional regulator, partial [Alphaproteobacteria bacterium]